MAGKRTLGVRSKENPPRKPVSSIVTQLNVGAMAVLAERGITDVMEVEGTPQYERMFGDYKSDQYSRYCVDGFFNNLRGVPGKLKIKRFVAADAVAAVQNVPAGSGFLALLITLVNEIKSKYNTHLSTSGKHGVNDLTNVVTSKDAIDFSTAVTLLKEMRAYFNAHVADAILATGRIWHTGVSAGTDYSSVLATPEDMATAVAVANELRANFIFHAAEAPPHLATTAITFTAPAVTDPALTTDVLGLTAGFRGKVDKGAHGNNLAYQVKESFRFATATTAASLASATVFYVTAVTPFEVGEQVVIKGPTGGVWHIEGAVISAKDEAAGTITVSSAVTYAYAVGSEIKVLNFDLLLYRKNRKGALELKENWAYLNVCSGTSRYFVDVLNDAYKGSEQVMAEDLTPVVADIKYKIPYSNLTPTYFSDTAGDDGTAPTSEDWVTELASFDTHKDVRYIAAPESVADRVNAKIRDFANTKGYLVALCNFSPNLAYEEAKVAAQKFLQSGASYFMENLQWIKVSDPIGLGDAPLKEVPNVGHIMGHAVYRIATYGYQRVPAGPQVDILDVVDIVGDQILDDTRRTELADLGLNVLQYVEGSGFVLRNARMASTDAASKWFNQAFMKAVYKRTFEDAFKGQENNENGEEILKSIYFGIRAFLLSDFKGNARTGGKPAFLITKLPSGKMSTFDDVVQIIADQTNNELSEVLAGNANADLYFTPPPPAESIEIGVGISLNLGSK